MYINQQRSGYGSINFECKGRNIYEFYANKYINYLFEIKKHTALCTLNRRHPDYTRPPKNRSRTHHLQHEPNTGQHYI